MKVTFSRFLLVSLSLYFSPRILERLALTIETQEIEQPFCVILPKGASALLPELIDLDIEHSGDRDSIIMHGKCNLGMHGGVPVAETI